MLGWDKVFGITNRILAEKLGVTESQVKYILFAKEYRDEAKFRRIANNNSKAIKFANYYSDKQDFNISYPKVWVVTTDERYQEESVLFCNGDHEFPKIEQGLFQVCHSNENDEYCAMAEVVKLKLVSPISALELYKLDKPAQEAVPLANRPHHEMMVDGMSAVKYFYVFDPGEFSELSKMPKFLNVYLTDDTEGWIISCSCTASRFNEFKPVFASIIDSFKRKV